MPIGVLALQGDFEAHAAAVERAGGQARLVRRAEELDGLEGLILPGGESTTMLKLLAQDGLQAAVSEFIQHRPTFGTCAGAILLAREVEQPAQASLGLLDVAIARNAYGRQLDSSIREAEVQPEYRAELGAERIESVLIRAPQFTQLGPGVEVVAVAGGRPVLVRQGHIIAATFHPELSPGVAVHRWFLH